MVTAMEDHVILLFTQGTTRFGAATMVKRQNWLIIIAKKLTRLNNDVNAFREALTLLAEVCTQG